LNPSKGSGDNMEKEIFKKKLKELKKYRGSNNELVSYYIPHNKSINYARSHIENEVAETENIKSKHTRKNVKKALKHIKNNLKWLNEIPDYGLIIFVGETEEQFVSEFIEPPEPLDISDYKCGSKFYTEPIDEFLDDKEEVGLIVVSRGEATLGVFNGKNISRTKYIESQVPSKHQAGGFSQQRFERDTERAKNEFFKEVSKEANRVFEGIDKVILGGHGKTKDDFRKDNKLRHDLEIADSFSTNYTDESGLEELVDKAKSTLDEMEMIEERKMVDKFMEMIKTDEGLVEYGEDEIRTMINVGAVDKLMISDDHSVEKIEEFKELVEQKGGEIEVISTDSNKGKIFSNTFNGLGAFLRFRYN